jgi:hypothetical protein
MFLFYIATAMVSTLLFNKATAGKGTAAIIAAIAAHQPELRLAIVFGVITIFDALVLGAALYAITRDQDRDLALVALLCRAGEGVAGVIPSIAALGLLSIATAPADAAAYALVPLLLKAGNWSTTLSATLFAVGSTLFCWLFLRARTIPAPLAWLGLVASVLLVFVLPAQLVGSIRGALVWSIWMPMLVFEVTLALWLLIKGAARPLES